MENFLIVYGVFMSYLLYYIFMTIFMHKLNNLFINVCIAKFK